MEIRIVEDRPKELEPECPPGVRAGAWLMIGLVGLWVAIIAGTAAFVGPQIDPWNLKNAALSALGLLTLVAPAITAVYTLKGRLWAYYVTLALSGLTAASQLAESYRSHHWLLVNLSLIVPAVSILLLLLGKPGYLAFARHRAGLGRQVEPEAAE